MNKNMTYIQSSYYSTPEGIKLAHVEKWSWAIKIVNKISQTGKTNIAVFSMYRAHTLC